MSLSEVPQRLSLDLFIEPLPTTTPTSTRLFEPFTIKTRSKSIFESQEARIFTRSQSDLPRRQTLDNPEFLLRRSSSTLSKAPQIPSLRRSASSTPLPQDKPPNATSNQTSRRSLLKRSRSSETIFTQKIATEASIPPRTSKRLKLLVTPQTTPSSSNPSSNPSKDPSPAPDSLEPSSQSSQSSISSTTRTVLPKLKGKDLFDAMVWQDPLTTSIFLTFIAELRKKIRTEVKGTAQSHKLIKALRDGGRLVRCYTQNVDGLESREGLDTDLASGTGRRSRFFSGNLSKPRPDDGGEGGDLFGGVEVVQLHGGLDNLRCSLCGEQSPWQRDAAEVEQPKGSSTTNSSSADNLKHRDSGDYYDDDEDQLDREETLRGGRAPGCQRCIRADEARQHRGRRSVAVGKLRPDVVLYGEEHPEANRIGELVTHDISLSPDVILIMGTSLRVHGLKVIVKEFARAAHAKGGKVVFVNNTKPPESTWGDILDYWVEMDCDHWITDLKERRGELWLPQGLPVESKSGEESSTRRTSGLGQLDSNTMPARKSLPGMPKSAPTSKKTNPSTGAASEPKPSVTRPQCLREDEMNGAYWAYQIQLNLEIIGGRPRMYAPNCNPHRKWGNEKWRRKSGKSTSATTLPSSSALTSISSNIPRPVKGGKVDGAAGSQLQRELSASVGPISRSNLLLPTPPPSDETEEPELPQPLTPRTRIKEDSSIKRILSSPVVGMRTRSSLGGVAFGRTDNRG